MQTFKRRLAGLVLAGLLSVSAQAEPWNLTQRLPASTEAYGYFRILPPGPGVSEVHDRLGRNPVFAVLREAAEGAGVSVDGDGLQWVEGDCFFAVERRGDRSPFYDIPR